jgi:uroporphyrinogen decarboxylase
MITSRQRVRRTLERQPTDRIPNGLGGCETAGMHMLAYDK